jgi:hypothetical protein
MLGSKYKKPAAAATSAVAEAKLHVLLRVHKRRGRGEREREGKSFRFAAAENVLLLPLRLYERKSCQFGVETGMDVCELGWRLLVVHAETWGKRGIPSATDFQSKLTDIT